MEEKPRRGRPRKGYSRRKIYICKTALDDREIMPEEALELVQGLPCDIFTYESLSNYTKKPLKDTMKIMNDLIHYGLMKFHGKEGKESVFERSITNCDQ